MTITGGCLCGAIRYESSAEPLAVRTCWCRLCQYLGGGSATVNVCFPSEAVTFSGTLSDHVSIADSGNVMHRGFCPTCGTPITSTAESRPHLVFIRAGTLDDTSIAAPQATIWTSAAPDWACFNESIPAHAEQLPPVA
jgi:hypothetical protein